MLKCALSRLFRITVLHFSFLLTEPLSFPRQPEACVWRNIITQVDAEDLLGLLSIDGCLLYALGSCRKLRYDIFVQAKEYFFKKIAGEILEDKKVHRNDTFFKLYIFFFL